MKDYELLNEQGQATPLSNFLAAHHGYRRDAARFPAGVRALAAKGLPADGVDALRKYWKGFDQALLTHHEMEDNFLFPMYKASHPELSAEIDTLFEQHHELDEIIATIDGWLAKLPEDGAVEPTVAAFEALESHVNEHLDLEETHIVPLMLEDPPTPPGAPGGPPGGGPGGQGGPPGGVPEDLDFAFLGPWLADGLDDTTVAALLEVAPPPFKINFDENRRSFAELLHTWSTD
jgi:hypothetical protein